MTRRAMENRGGDLVQVALAMTDLTQVTEQTMEEMKVFLEQTRQDIQAVGETSVRAIETSREETSKTLQTNLKQVKRAGRLLGWKTWLLALTTGAVISLGVIGFWIWRHPSEHAALGKKIYTGFHKLDEKERQQLNGLLRKIGQ